MFAFRVSPNNTFKLSYEPVEVKVIKNILVASYYEKDIEEEIETKDKMMKIEDKLKNL